MARMLSLAALTAVLIVPGAYAQVGTAEGKAPVNDSLFASAAAAGGLAELSISEMGVQKATDPDLKKFSQQMVDEHSRMNQELTALATSKRINLPKMLDPRAQFCGQSLAGLSGKDFDRCYAKAQFLVHMEAVATFEAEAERGQDREMKALAAKALPKIKGHLRMIKPIAMRYEKDEPSDSAR